MTCFGKPYLSLLTFPPPFPSLLSSLFISDIHAGRAELQQQRHKYVQQFEQVKTQLNTGVQPYRGGGGGGGGVGGFDGMDGYDDIEAFFPGEGVGGGGGGVGGRRKSAAEGRFKRKSNREPTSRPRNK